MERFGGGLALTKIISAKPLRTPRTARWLKGLNVLKNDSWHTINVCFLNNFNHFIKFVPKTYSQNEPHKSVLKLCHLSVHYEVNYNLKNNGAFFPPWTDLLFLDDRLSALRALRWIIKRLHSGRKFILIFLPCVFLGLKEATEFEKSKTETINKANGCWLHGVIYYLGVEWLTWLDITLQREMAAPNSKHNITFCSFSW